MFDSKFAHYTRKSNDNLIGEFQRESFYDSELDIYVMDNMNGLRHISDYQAVEVPSYFNVGFADDGLWLRSKNS